MCGEERRTLEHGKPPACQPRAKLKVATATFVTFQQAERAIYKMHTKNTKKKGTRKLETDAKKIRLAQKSIILIQTS